MDMASLTWAKSIVRNERGSILHTKKRDHPSAQMRRGDGVRWVKRTPGGIDTMGNSAYQRTSNYLLVSGVGRGRRAHEAATWWGSWRVCFAASYWCCPARRDDGRYAKTRKEGAASAAYSLGWAAQASCIVQRSHPSDYTALSRRNNEQTILESWRDDDCGHFPANLVKVRHARGLAETVSEIVRTGVGGWQVVDENGVDDLEIQPSRDQTWRILACPHLHHLA